MTTATDKRPVATAGRLLGPDERLLVTFDRDARLLTAYAFHRHGHTRVATGRALEDGHVTITLENGHRLTAYAGAREPHEVACQPIADHVITQRSLP